MYDYGYSNIYLNFSFSSEIPTTWNNNWCYSTYGYSSYTYKYYKNDWELVNNVPTIK